MKLRNIVALAGKMVNSSRPMALIYFVTKRCNANCAHCFYWESLNKQPRNELSIEEIRQIATQFGPMAYLRLSGGEPFLRLDLFELVEAFVVSCEPLTVGIPSNGYYTDRMEAFVRQSASLRTRIEIGISIDGLREQHDKIRGSKNAYEKAIQSFIRLKALQKDIPNLRVGFITTAIRSNQDTLMELFDYLSNLDPDSIACNVVRDNLRHSEEKDIDMDLCDEFSQRVDQYNQKKVNLSDGWFNRLRDSKSIYAHEVRQRTIEEDAFQIPCVAGGRITVMYADGEVFPCETLTDPIGNIREFNYSFGAILSSPKAVALRRKIIEDKCHCSHECFTTASIAFSPKQMAHIVSQTIFNRNSIVVDDSQPPREK